MQSSSAAAVPDVISQLVDRTFIFKVEVEKETDLRFGKSICVKKIFDDPAILQQFKELKFPQGSVTASGGFGGEKGCLTTTTSNANIAQDLMSKFSETMTDRGGVAKGKEIIASENTDDECTVLKRSSPEADSEISTSAPAKLLKSEIKIEKN